MPYLKPLLKGEDENWKYWVLSEIVSGFKNDAIKELLPELKRVAYSPTDGEKLEELDIVAAELLQRIE